jgi:hypothetical protein
MNAAAMNAAMMNDERGMMNAAMMNGERRNDER